MSSNEEKEINSSNVRTDSISPEILGTDNEFGHVFKTDKWIKYRYAWDDYPKNNLVGQVPLQIDLFAVDACNLKCPMCPRHSAWNSEKKGYMDSETIYKIIDEAGEKGLMAFNFGGLGEPTVHPDHVNFLKYAKEKGVIDVNMHTNGTRLNEKRSKAIVESGVDRIVISLDSAVKETYEKIRVGATFEKVYSEAEKFIELRNKYAKQDEYGDLHPHIKVNFINMNEDDDRELNYFVDRWKDKANRIGVLRYIDFECYEEEHEKLVHIDNYYQIQDFSCGELWRRLAIWSCGTATICFRDFNQLCSVGNIHEQSIEEIWNGEKMNYYRDLHLNGNYKSIPMCKNCPNSYECHEDYKVKGTNV